MEGAGEIRLYLRQQLRRVRKLVRILRRPRSRRALLSGVRAAVEHADVPFHHTPATVLDVGAHHGQFALLVCDLFPAASIVCFEPLQGARAKLRRVVPQDRLTIVDAAVGATSGRGTLHVSLLDHSSSLLPISERQHLAFPGTEESHVETVDVRTLDELVDAAALGRPCLLKIDVQGAELEVVRGATRTLGAVDEILVECSFVELYESQALAAEVIAALAARGFDLVGVYSLQRDAGGEPVQADFHLVRSEANRGAEVIPLHAIPRRVSSA